MVAAEAADKRRQQPVVDPDIAAGLVQGGCDAPSAACGAPAVDEDPHLHSAARSLSQRLDEARPHT
jgi:hypothetical protein